MVIAAAPFAKDEARQDILTFFKENSDDILERLQDYTDESTGLEQLRKLFNEG